MTNTREIKVAVAGNPNSGKTTLFNAITGSSLKVGNWPGVTVEKFEGTARFDGKTFRFIDLPGTYSLSAYSPEERITRDFLLYEMPDVVLIVVDASNLERNLYLVAQIVEIGHPAVIALNMFDIAQRYAIEINVGHLEKLLGIPVVPTVSVREEGISELLSKILAVSEEKMHPKPVVFAAEIEESILEIDRMMRSEIAEKNLFPRCHIRRYVVEKLLENDPELWHEIMKDFPKNDELANRIRALRQKIEGLYGSDINTIMAKARYAWASGITHETMSRKHGEKLSPSDKVDRIVLNRCLGFPIFAVVMFMLFYLTFTIGGFFTNWLDKFFTFLALYTDEKLTSITSPLFSSLISDGIISGVGGVLVFLPNIAILFLLIGLLEDSGYIARAAFIMDRVMHRFGLHGQSFIPILLGFGCSVPAIMATRALRNSSDRLTTSLILPFIPCSARLPILILFASILFPKNPSIVVFGAYFLGIAVALIAAMILNKIFWGSLSSPFVMELPLYHKPTLRIIIRHTLFRVGSFVKKAGTIILLGAIVIWFLGNFPSGVEYSSEQSYAGKIGKFISPMFAPQKIEWQGTVSLIFGIIAKEIVVSSLAVLYGENLENTLPKHFPTPTAWAFLIFAMLYTPCIPTLASIRSETGKTKWLFASVALSLSIAWLASYIAYIVAAIL